LSREDEMTSMMNYIREQLEGVEKDEIVDYLETIVTHGCVSGSGIDMVYYEDTMKFYRTFRDEINNYLNEIDTRPDQLNGWDHSDPLSQHASNQNLLAWVGYEAAAYALLIELEGDE